MARSSEHLYSCRPKVSVVVPVHNTATYLSSCIKSILEQTLKDIEIILVENGSTDNSYQVCLDISLTDERIRVIRIDEADLSTARNEGVRYANGEYVGFVDSDDTILPEMYEHMYRLAITNELGLVDCNFYCYYDNKPNRYPYSQNGKVRIVDAKEAVVLNLQEKISRIVCSMLYRRELFNFLKFPTHMYYEDRASTFLFMAAAKRVGIINKAYYGYYQRSGSINRAKSFQKYRDYAKADCCRLRFIRESGLFQSGREQASIAYKSGNAFVRTLGHMVMCANTHLQKKELKHMSYMSSLIPKGTMLSLKQCLILLYIKIWRCFV